MKNLFPYVCPSLLIFGLVTFSSPAHASKIFAGTQTIEPANSTSQILLNIPSGTGGNLATTAVRVGLGDIGLRSSASVSCGFSGCGAGVFGVFAGVYGSEDLITLSAQSGFIRFDFDLTGTMGASGSSPTSAEALFLLI